MKRVKYGFKWHGAWQRWIWVVMSIGCGTPVQQTAAKVAIQEDARSCDEKASAIIQAAETCEQAVRGLNALVAKDARCQNVFHAKDPGVTCSGVGTQPRKVER